MLMQMSEKQLRAGFRTACEMGNVAVIEVLSVLKDTWWAGPPRLYLFCQKDDWRQRM